MAAIVIWTFGCLFDVEALEESIRICPTIPPLEESIPLKIVFIVSHQDHLLKFQKLVSVKRFNLPGIPHISI